MGGQFFGEQGKSFKQRAGVAGIDAAAADLLHHLARRLFRRDETAVLERTALLLGEGALRGGRAALGEEAVEPLLAVDAGEVGVADGRGMVDQALLEAGPGLGRGERSGL